MLLDQILLKKDEVLSIFEKYGATNVKIIGSVSKRKEKENSDIDFVADLKLSDNGAIDLQAHADLIRELRDYFNRKIDLASHQQINLQYPIALSKGIALNR